MKDTNIYSIELKLKAKTGESSIKVAKNGRYTLFEELPQTEKEKIAALAAQGYIYLDDKLNNKQKK